MNRRTAALLLVAVVTIAGVLAYAIGEVRVATARTERAIVEMDGWLRLAGKLESEQARQVKDIIDLNLDGALVTVILNSGPTMLDSDTERQLQEHLEQLNKYWTAHPPYAGPQWESLRASKEWRDELASRMAFLSSRSTQRGKQ